MRYATMKLQLSAEFVRPMQGWRGLLAAGAAGLALAFSNLAPSIATAGEAGPDLSGSGQSVFLPYLNAPLASAPITRPPQVGVSVGGAVVRAVLDTGSTGVVIAARAIPNLSQLKSLGPGTITYTSSGRIMRGDWVVAPVTLSGPNGAQVTSRPIPVLAVRRIDCLKAARNCRVRTHPTHVAMVGIGFAREKDRQAEGTPDRNPLLNLPAMGTPEAPGAMRRGYVVTKQGIQVGVTAEGAKGFTFAKLDKSDRFPDWAPIPVCLSLNDRQPPACGTVLVDTGVDTMYLTLPASQLNGQTVQAPDGKPTLPPSARLNLDLLGEGKGVSYAFAVGNAADSVAPARVILVPRPGEEAFVNTSVRLLNRFDYLFDADAGYAGFRSRMPRGAAH
ncbi:hypothetical protein J5J86_20140 [Aquabacter sp. L1I39]|uniref:hypothetical protein n=1 Tax=Aquabacter sp. L1I39 TaxID=2820278 RepID=UPI001AD98BD6|nr:hypothetical protein [Aquabacter sp. L1I39]QTL03048.1 hypothetical protein J5J86_20140 [Aquabacter sp. L1I39]